MKPLVCPQVKAKIRTVRKGGENLQKIALDHQKQIRQSGIEEIRDKIREQALGATVEPFIEGDRKSVHESISNVSHRARGKAPGEDKSLTLLDKIRGADSDISSYLDKWYNRYDVKTKTRKEAKKHITNFAEKFRQIKMITGREARFRIEREIKRGKSAKTINRYLNSLSKF